MCNLRHALQSRDSVFAGMPVATTDRMDTAIAADASTDTVSFGVDTIRERADADRGCPFSRTSHWIAAQRSPQVPARASSSGLPPGPRTPAFAQTLEWALRPVRYLERARAMFGHVFTSRLAGFLPIVHVGEPDIVREVFTGPPDWFLAGAANGVLEPLLGAESLFVLDGDRHRQRRRALQPVFRAQRVEPMDAAVYDIAARAIARWPRNRVVPLHDRLHELALELVLHTTMGVEDDEERRALAADLADLVDRATRPVMLLRVAQVDLGGATAWGRLMRVRRSVDRRLFALIARRRSSAREAAGGAQPRDVLSRLMCVRDEAGWPLSDEVLRAELLTLIVAGHDTVAAALAWSVHHLLDNPQWLARARAEADRALSVGARDALADELPDIGAVLDESLRLSPVLPIVGRTLARDLRIGRLELPAGVRVAPNAWLAHRNPACWSAPERFDPERFLRSRPSPFAYFPFGGGTRRCVGMVVAQRQMRVVLAAIVRGVDVSRAPGSRVLAVRRGVALVPSSGLPVTVANRG